MTSESRRHLMSSCSQVSSRAPATRASARVVAPTPRASRNLLWRRTHESNAAAFLAMTGAWSRNQSRSRARRRVVACGAVVRTTRWWCHERARGDAGGPRILNMVIPVRRLRARDESGPELVLRTLMTLDANVPSRALLRRGVTNDLGDGRPPLVTREICG